MTGVKLRGHGFLMSFRHLYHVNLTVPAGLLARGLRPELARVTVARKLAAITLPIWKKGEAFEVDKLIKHAA